MKVIVLSIGSRGDVEPFCALIQRLLLLSTSRDTILKLISLWNPIINLWSNLYWIMMYQTTME